jgi:hypothetical protein
MNTLRLSEAEWTALNAKRKGTEKPQERTPAAVAQSDKAPLLLRDQIVAAGLPEPFREFTFHSTRGWRLDLGWPQLKRAVEIDGQVHRIKGRFLADIERHNAMVMAGWTYLRFTPRQVETGEALSKVQEWFA